MAVDTKRLLGRELSQWVEPTRQAGGRAPRSTSAVRVQDVSHTYQSRDGLHLPALDSVSLSVERGELVAVLGPSGCGKSTLLRIVAGLLAPTSGQVSLWDLSPTEARHQRALGWMAQGDSLFPWRTVKENVRLPFSLSSPPVRGKSSQRSSRGADETLDVLASVGLAESSGRFPHELSGGMRQRVALARALVMTPPFLLLDEPFAHLDEISRPRMGDLLLGLVQERQVTTVLVTHGASEAVRLADRVLVLSSGPGRVLLDLRIDLPHPRREDNPLFGRLVRHLLDTILLGGPPGPDPRATISSTVGERGLVGSKTVDIERPALTQGQESGSSKAAVSRTSPRAMAARFADVVPSLALLFLMGAGWESVVRFNGVPPYLLPAPSAVLERWLADPRFFLQQGGITLAEALAGLAVGSGLAFSIGILMAEWRWLERAVLPLAIVVKMTPVVVLAPLFVLWFGFGALPRVLIAALLAFFPVLVAAVSGLRGVEPSRRDVLAVLNASRFKELVLLRLPSALPQLFAGLKVSATLALLGAVIAEWLGGDTGLGRVILLANVNLDVATALAGVFTLGLFGTLLVGFLTLIERRLLFWHPSS